MSRPRWPDSMNPASEVPGTIQQRVLWSFEDRLVSVFPSDSDGGEHIVDAPLDELIVQEQ